MVAIIVAEEGVLSSLKETGQGGVCMGLRGLDEPWSLLGEQAKGEMQIFLWACALVMQYGTSGLREDSFSGG